MRSAGLLYVIHHACRLDSWGVDYRRQFLDLFGLVLYRSLRNEWLSRILYLVSCPNTQAFILLKHQELGGQKSMLYPGAYRVTHCQLLTDFSWKDSNNVVLIFQ